MDKISDVFEFNRIIDSVHELARGLPATRDDLIIRLDGLIEDALAELTGEKFDIPRSMGDLDGADGICHLLDDYPTSVVFFSTNEEAAAFYRLKLCFVRASLRFDVPRGTRAMCHLPTSGAFLSTNEEAAASCLLALYFARNSLRDDFGLPEDSIPKIEATGRELLASRLHGVASEHDKRNRAQKRGGSKGGVIKAKRQKQKIAAWHARIQKRAKSMKGDYSKTEALDVLEREFPGYTRRHLATIVSSIFPTKPRRAKSGN